MSSDPHTGGRLEDFAQDGTTIPGDAGLQNTIRSVPRPDQRSDAAGGSLGTASLETAADNPTDIPRQFRDIGASGEVITGTGDQLPAEIETKRLHLGPNEPASKGHDRYHKHGKQNVSDMERYAGNGADVSAAPGEELDEQDILRDRRDIKQ